MIQLTKTEHRAYILDTNVLIHDPAAVLRFEEHEVLIPMTVLEELDKLKSGHSEVARSARQATRMLSELIADADLSDLATGVPIQANEADPVGTLRFLPHVSPEQARNDLSVPDNQILVAALQAHEERPDRTVILISKDINLRVKAAAHRLPVEDYRHDAVFKDTDAMSEGVFFVEGPIWETLSDYEPLPRGEAHTQPRFRVRGEPVQSWHTGMLIHDSEGFEAIVREVDVRAASAEIETCMSFRNGRNVWGVNARDARQNFAFNLLLDPEIDLVTLAGVAGTGKTFLAMASALALVFDAKQFERIIITRETVAMGEDIGFLPGSEEEKLGPWVRGFYDAIEELIRIQDNATADMAKKLIESRLQIRSLGLMRGRTFHDTLLIIDEAQNLTPRQAKNLLSRCGRNTKVLCMGNVAQIDTPYLTPSTSGLAHMVQRFRDWPHAGHVTLDKVERSRLAEASEELL